VAEQQAKIQSLKVALEETILRAPFDGIVTAIYFEPGTNVHAKETVIRVVGGGSDLRLRMALPEEETAIARVGSTTQLALDDGRALAAKLSRVSTEVDPITRTIFVEGDIDTHGDADLTAQLAGRTVRASITP